MRAFGELNVKRCPPKSNIHYSTIQKDIKHYYKAKIISKQTNCGIHTICYVGGKSIAKHYEKLHSLKPHYLATKVKKTTHM